MAFKFAVAQVYVFFVRSITLDNCINEYEYPLYLSLPTAQAPWRATLHSQILFCECCSSLLGSCPDADP